MDRKFNLNLIFILTLKRIQIKIELNIRDFVYLNFCLIIAMNTHNNFHTVNCDFLLPFTS